MQKNTRIDFTGQEIYVGLDTGKKSWKVCILTDADLRGAFDNVSHQFIISAIGDAPGRKLIKQWLKAGYVEAEMFHQASGIL